MILEKYLNIFLHSVQNMKNSNLLLFVFLVFSVLPLASYAETKIAKIEPIKDRIYENETAQFKITVLQNGTYTVDVSVYTFEWFFYTDPVSVYFSPHPFKEGDEFFIFLKPMKVEPKTYVFSLTLKNETYEEIIPLRIFVLTKPVVQEEYPLLVKVDTSISKTKYYPNETVFFDIYLENKNPRNVGIVEVTIKNDFYSVVKNYNLKPRTKEASPSDYKILDVLSFKIPEKITPRKSTIFVVIKYENEVFSKSLEFEILPIEKGQDIYDFKEKRLWNFFILEKNYTIHLINQGNVPLRFYKKIPVGRFLRYVDGNATLINSTIIVDETIPPYSERFYVLNINYRPYYTKILFTIAIVLIVIILYFLLRAPFVVSKNLVKSYIKDGFLYLAFEISVKNRSRRRWDEVVVKEKLPLACEYVDKGIFKPEVYKTHEGLVLKWKLTDVDKYEENIISYTVRFKFQLFGRTIFSPATIFYKKGNKVFKLISNELVVDL